MNSSITKLNREFKEYSKKYKLAKEKNEELQIALFLRENQDSLFKWIAVIKGQKDTPYEHGEFYIQIDVPENYPHKPPKCYFITKIFHPNVHFNTGEICHELLNSKWSGSCTLENVCISILDMMNYPCEDSPLNCDAGNLLRYNDYIGYKSLAKMYTIEFANYKTNL